MDSAHSSDQPARSSFARRLPMVLGELAVLGAAWWFMKLDPPLVGAIAGVIVLSVLVPERYDSLVTGVGMLGLASLVYFYYGARPLAAVLGVFALVMLATGIPKARGRASSASGDGP